MPRRPGQKRKLPALLAILTKESDEEHPISLSRLSELLFAQYGIAAERKSLYDDLETLTLLGHDVVRCGAGPSTGYYLGARDFETAEWKLMADAVQSSRFLTEKKAADLIDKLLQGASVYQREKLVRQVHVANRLQKGGERVLYTVDLLHEAICENRQISFRYTQRNAKGHRVLRHGGQTYTVSPWALCWDDEFYYLIAYSEPHGEIRHYRVDRLDSPKLLDAKRLGEETFAHFDMSAYSRAVFGMFGGKTTEVTLRCANRLADVIFDRFGDGCVLRAREDAFEVTVPVMVSPAFLSWVLGFGGEMKILAPKEAARELINLGKEALALYE